MDRAKAGGRQGGASPRVRRRPAITSKHITGTYAAGYTLSAAYSAIRIAPTGRIEGTGLLIPGLANVFNGGAILASAYQATGVDLAGGDRLVNYRPGAIHGGVGMNGADNSSPGGVGGPGGDGGTGVVLEGGPVNNRGAIAGGAGGRGGDDSSPTGAGGYGGIGGTGVTIAGFGSVVNRGVITGGAGGAGGRGTYYGQNGGDGGGGGVGAQVGGGQVTNYGVITGGAGGLPGYQGDGSGYGGAGVQLGGGDLVNRGTISGGVSIDYGGAGVSLQFGAGSVMNYGVIAGGRAIDGVAGVGVSIQSRVLTNHGVITGGNSDNGVAGAGVSLVGGGLVTNYGVIAGGVSNRYRNFGFFDGVGVTLAGTLVNRGLIQGGGGAVGVVTSFAYASTVENAGTIQGLNQSVVFNSNRDVLVADAGAQFIGAVVGGDGTLELAGGAGVISGLGRRGQLTGDDSATFSGFRAFVIGAGGHWNLSGPNALTMRQSLTVDGGLIVGGSLREAAGATVTVDRGGALRFQGPGQTLAGSIVNQGLVAVRGTTLTITGPAGGDGRAQVTDGTLAVASALAWKVEFAGASAVLDLSQSRNFAGSVSNFAAGGQDVLDLGDIAFTGAGEATFAGDASGGLLTVSDGTNTASIRLIGDYLGDSFVAASDGAGGVAITAAASAGPSAHPFVAAMAGLGAAAATSPAGAETHLQHRPMLLAGCSRA